MSDRHTTGSLCGIILWLMIVVYAGVTVLPDAFPDILSSPLNLPLGIIVPLAFALLHGALRYRITGIVVFLVVCLGISNLMENIGVLTGFPFGPYHYTDVLGPKLFNVPILIGPAYFGTGYLSWMLANVVLGTDRRHDGKAAFLVPVVATFIMVGWDVCLDPGSSTVGHIWIWHRGGGFFGVPFSNYLGWYLTVYLFLQVFALYRAWQSEAVVPTLPRSYWYQACVLFAVMGIDFLAAYYGGHNARISDAAGHQWQTGDIYETGAIVSLYTMLFVAVMSAAVILLGRGPETSGR